MTLLSARDKGQWHQHGHYALLLLRKMCQGLAFLDRNMPESQLQESKDSVWRPQQNELSLGMGL